MRENKDWSYFRYDVGHYEPGLFDKAEEFKPYKPETKKLVWYIFNEEHGKIVPINLFEYNWVFLRDGLLVAKKKYNDDFNKFADHIRRWLSYEYCSRSQYETVITTWPTFIDEEELNRLNDEYKKSKEEGHVFYRQTVNTGISFKLDVYTQVMLNWDRFIEYVWNNKHLITAKKLGIEGL